MKQKIILCLVFALVLSGCVKSVPFKTDTSLDTKEKVVSQDVSKLSIKELLTKGDSLKCSLNDSLTKQEGTYYIDGKTQKMRADIKMSIGVEGEPAKIVSNSMIMDKNTIYSWSSDQSNIGMKITVDPTTLDSPDVDKKTVDMDSKMDFNCQKWTVDSSLFTVPTNITFTDLSETMNDIQKLTKDAGQDMCKICDSMPEGKADCQKMYCK